MSGKAVGKDLSGESTVKAFLQTVYLQKSVDMRDLDNVVDHTKLELEKKYKIFMGFFKHLFQILSC